MDIHMSGKLRYYYGTMNSLKSGTLLTKAHQFKEAGCNVILLKPSRDTRDEGIISSRAIKGYQECHTFNDEQDLFSLIVDIMMDNEKAYECKDIHTVVFVDEINFITSKQVDQLWRASRIIAGVDVFAYGLKNTYQNELFPASERLLTIADTVEEIKSMCAMPHCSSKATTHIRYIGDKPVFSGETFVVSDVVGEEHIKSVCQECWFTEYDVHG